MSPNRFRWLLISLAMLSGCQALPDVPEPTTLRSESQLVRGSPSIAVSLAGGGSKAAPVALGALQGLVEEGDLKEIDTISSVSGGGYAALYLYSRARDIAEQDPLAPATLADSFDDCLPFRYNAFAANETSSPCPRENINNYVKGDRYRFQNYLRGYQSLLRRDFVYKSTSQGRGALNASMAKHLGTSLATAIPHHLVNSLLDWKLRISPTGKAYDEGIHRTWGRTGAICESDSCMRTPVGELDPARGMTFPQLKAVIASSRRPHCAVGPGSVCGLPNWLINATAADNPVRQYIAATPYTLQNVFTFTAEGYGSDARGRHEWDANRYTQPNVTVPEATATAAAFFDLMTSNSFSPPGRLLTSGAQHLLNLSWGHVHPNFNLSKSEFKRRRFIHRLLPFPLYLLHRNNYGPEGINIRLSDGGRAENLGAYSALRTDATDLIVVDAAEDSKATLQDVCALRTQLHALGGEHQGAKWQDIELDGLRFGHRAYSLDVWCDKDKRREIVKLLESGPSRLEESELIRHWPAPVLAGCILSKRANGRSCAEADEAGDVQSRMFLVKPAITADAYQRFKSWHDDSRVPGCFHLPDDSRKAASDECSALAQELLDSIGDRLPVEVQAFLVPNFAFHIFPQHSTWRTTAHSSPWIFGAYRELIRHYMRYLEINRGAAQPVCIRKSPHRAKTSGQLGLEATHPSTAWGMCSTSSIAREDGLRALQK